MAASDYLESGVLNHVFRSSTFSKPATIAVALTTGLAVDADTGATMPEVANAGAYARVDLGPPADADWNFMVQSNGSGLIDNVSAVQFPQATANWGMVSGVAILDSGVHGAGNLLLHAPLATPRDIKNNDQFQFQAGELDLLLS